MQTMNIKAVDFFCGVGGLTYGLQQSGINVIAGIDSDQTCKYAYEANNEAVFIHEDITKISSNDISQYYNQDDIKILIGCAPCQTFSSHTQKNKNRQQDQKWTLLHSFAEHITAIQPDIISMENVPDLVRFPIFEEFVRKLQEQNYYVTYKIINCEKIGLPQRRKRLVLLASKYGEITFIDKQYKTKTVKDVLSTLPALKHGEQDAKDLLHMSASLSTLNLQRMKQSKPGGSWQDWDEELRLECHKKKSGASYKSVYGRMEWDKISPTITTQFFAYGTGRFGHPEQDRALSLREGAILQSFPKKYKFIPKGQKISKTTIARHIGNAVPVDLGKYIGYCIQQHIKKYEQAPLKL